jgi:hypothetical protein
MQIRKQQSIGRLRAAVLSLDTDAIMMKSRPDPSLRSRTVLVIDLLRIVSASPSVTLQGHALRPPLDNY